MRAPRRMAAIGLTLALVLYVPALLSFWMHVFEHLWPLGFTRAAPAGAWQLPLWLGRALVWFAYHSVVPTWCGIAVAIVTSTSQTLSWRGRSWLAALSVLTYVSMLGIDAVAHSCWGEAPHVFGY